MAAGVAPGFGGKADQDRVADRRMHVERADVGVVLQQATRLEVWQCSHEPCVRPAGLLKPCGVVGDVSLVPFRLLGEILFPIGVELLLRRSPRLVRLGAVAVVFQTPVLMGFVVRIPKLPRRLDLLRLYRALGVDNAQDVGCQLDAGHGDAPEQRLRVVVEVVERP